MENNDKHKPKAKVSGENQNVFHLLTICKTALIDEGMYREAEQMANEIYETNSFGVEALEIMKKYCDLT